MGSRYHAHLFSFLLVILAAIPGIYAIEYKVINKAKGTEGGSIFERSITKESAVKAMGLAYDFIRSKLFEEEDPFRNKNIDTITLVIVENEKFWDKDFSKGIVLDADYFTEIADTHLMMDFTKNIYSFMTQLCLSENGNQYPHELEDAIVYFVLLEAGFAQTNWAKLRDAKTWNNGQKDVTAQFFMYCENDEPGFVAMLISNMKQFSSGYIKENVDRLWKQYKASHNHEGKKE